MANAKEYFLRGKCSWFRHRNLNQWGKWAHNLYLDKESLDLFRELQISDNGVGGVKNQLKKDEDGYFIAISRPQEVMMRGKKVGLLPPKVVDGRTVLPDGSNPPWPDDLLVGNGSDVTTKVEVYQHRVPGTENKARAMRWVSSRIDSLVPYSGKDEMLEEERRSTESLMEQPRPSF